MAQDTMVLVGEGTSDDSGWQLRGENATPLSPSSVTLSMPSNLRSMASMNFTVDSAVSRIELNQIPLKFEHPKAIKSDSEHRSDTEYALRGLQYW